MYNQTGNTSYVDSNGKLVSTPQFTQTTQYSPQGQAIFDASTAAQGNIANIASEQSANLENYLNTKFTPTGLPNVTGIAGQTLPANPNEANFQAEAATPFSYTNKDAANYAYDLASQRILPQQAIAQTALQTQLINRGLQPGTAAYNQQMTLLSQNQGDQLNQLAATTDQQGYNQALASWQQNVGQAQTAGDAAYNQAMGVQQQQYNEALGANQNAFSQQVAERNQPINEITALLGGSQLGNVAASSAAAPAATQVAGTDYAGLVENNYNQQVAQSNAALGGLFGLAGSAVSGATHFIPGFNTSDERLKTDIKTVGTLDNGLPVKQFRFKAGGPPQIGLIAQDVQKVKPEAVKPMPSGWLGVDYARATSNA
jgi:hypothetical protein